MNIRFNENSVRVRVTLEEARKLETKKKLVSHVCLSDGDLFMEVLLSKQQDKAINFSFSNNAAIMTIMEKEFYNHLEDRPSRNSFIKYTHSNPSGSETEYVFEIDLFSRKKSRE
jgi:hypothetical protein